jgi:hypothetical protein
MAVTRQTMTDEQRLFTDVGGTLKSITHDYAAFSWVFSGGDTTARYPWLAAEAAQG